MLKINQYEEAKCKEEQRQKQVKSLIITEPEPVMAATSSAPRKRTNKKVAKDAKALE